MKESAPEIHCCLPRGTGGAGDSSSTSALEARSPDSSGRSDGGARCASKPHLLKWLIREQWAQAAVANKAVRPHHSRRRPLFGPHPTPSHPGPGAWGRPAGRPRPTPAGGGRIPGDNKGAVQP